MLFDFYIDNTPAVENTAQPHSDASCLARPSFKPDGIYGFTEPSSDEASEQARSFIEQSPKQEISHVNVLRLLENKDLEYNEPGIALILKAKLRTNDPVRRTSRQAP
mmetsp:Transcript_12268/g.23283  ORF Transcript_12268/g.23283 Transcript_12268/m.23283 type:complete len:107 (-) Transcript_12268:423-743(-)